MEVWLCVNVTTTHNAGRKGSFSQQYNNVECVQTKRRMAGGSFSHSLNSEQPGRQAEKVRMTK